MFRSFIRIFRFKRIVAGLTIDYQIIEIRNNETNIDYSQTKACGLPKKTDSRQKDKRDCLYSNNVLYNFTVICLIKTFRSKQYMLNNKVYIHKQITAKL